MLPTPSPHFEVDAMLVKLARYLRCLGYYAACEPARPLRERLRASELEQRVFLTRNRRILHQERAPLRLFLVEAEDPVAQLAGVVSHFGLETSAHAFTRCIRCNLALEEVPKDERVRAAVEPGVWQSYAQFYACPGCRTVFWKGSHVRNTLRKLGLESAGEA